MTDLRGFTFTLGCTVARPVMRGNSPLIELCKVTRIDSGNLYLDNSKVAIRLPQRLLIIEHDPLIKMMDDHLQELTHDHL
jgi:hypothetical protein